MCHLSMKLSDKFDSNQMYTSDKIVVKHISVKGTLLKLDLEPKVMFGQSPRHTLDKIIAKLVSMKNDLKGQDHSKKQKIMT